MPRSQTALTRHFFIRPQQTVLKFTTAPPLALYQPLTTTTTTTILLPHQTTPTNFPLSRLVIQKLHRSSSNRLRIKAATTTTTTTKIALSTAVFPRRHLSGWKSTPVLDRKAPGLRAIRSSRKPSTRRWAWLMIERMRLKERMNLIGAFDLPSPFTTVQTLPLLQLLHCLSHLFLLLLSYQ